MGTMIDLRVGNLVADWGKNEFYRDHRSLFQRRDVRSVLAGQDPGGQEGMINTLSRSLRDVVPRLHLLGYTLESARAEYNGLLEIHVDEDSTYPTFDAFTAALCAIDIGDVSADYEDDHSFGEFFREEIGPRIDVNALFNEPHSGQWEYATMMENFHPWHVLILLAQEPTNLGLPVVWDYFAHMENGWSEPEDFVPNLKPEESLLIVTEGSSDSKVLQKAFAMFRPAIVDFFTFIDMEEGYPFSGSGNLATFCRGLAKIHIQNKTIALFDNDAEGVSKQKALENLVCPSTMRILRLPDHPALNSIASIGTSGETHDNINGRAASIEAYLDLEWHANRPALVRWTNYVQSLGVYQGALDSKEFYVRQFLNLRDAEARYDTSKLEAVLSTLIDAAEGIAKGHPARAEY
jgi:HEPN/Toprim N-terminal domain 1